MDGITTGAESDRSILAFDRAALAPTFELGFVNHSRNAGGWTTAITRVWSDFRPGGCRLCPKGECRASEVAPGTAVCLIAVQQYVPQEQCESFDLNGHPFVEHPEPAPRGPAGGLSLSGGDRHGA